MRALVSYDRYTEFLSKNINRTINPAELEDISHFEAARPETCPHCKARVRSQFMPGQIAHDIEKCQPKKTEP
jgi:hypothetical protein